jgi:hypothetical protein
MASIHQLFPAGSGDDARDPGQPPAQNPLVTELRKAALAALGGMMEKMFSRADDTLFEMGERAHTDTERRRYFDAMRVLRIDQAKITRKFSEDVERSFTNFGKSRNENRSSAINVEELSIQPTDELEERIAVTNLIARAEGLHKQLVWEVERRLEFAMREIGVPVSPQALAPARICDAFGSAIGKLDTEFQVKLVIYKLFEREVVRDMHRVYEAALDLLDRAGINPNSQRKPRRDVEQSGEPDELPGVSAVAPDPRILQMLRGFAAQQGARASTDSQLANELAAALRGAIDGSGMPGVSGEAPVQRLSLANQYFDALLSEPLLPESARPLLESLRFPVIKSALADPGFFTNGQHPLRQLLGELIDLGISGAIGDAVPQRKFRDSIRQVAERADVDAALVRTALNNLKPLDGPQLDQFLEQLREQEHSRREVLLTKVRRLVAQELDVQTVGRDVPSPAQNLLLSGIGPLMAVRLLRHGRGSAPYREAHDLLERLLDSLDLAVPTEQRVAERKALCDAIAAALASIGMRRERIDDLVSGLREAYESIDRKAMEADELRKQNATGEPEAAAAAAPAAAPPEQVLPTVTVMELLSRILAPESWFRVYDPERNLTRWLKLASFYVNQDSVSFSGFDEGIKLNLRASRFADDLVEGRSEPINPDARAREALDQLRKAKTAGVF